MKTLDEAWNWYQKNRRLLQLMSRLGRRYWKDLPWRLMENDDHFRLLDGQDVENDATEVLAGFDDIAIFVLFSVFEAIVRGHVWEDVEAETSALKHPALIKLAEKMKENIAEGSFYNNVLELYKTPNSQLVEAVSQIRTYRNWVAHGRREGRRPLNTTPRDAFDRLQAFLLYIGHRTAPIP